MNEPLSDKERAEVDAVAKALASKDSRLDSAPLSAVAQSLFSVAPLWEITVVDQKTGETTKTRSRANRTREQVEEFMRRYLMDHNYPNPVQITAERV